MYEVLVCEKDLNLLICAVKTVALILAIFSWRMIFNLK